MRLEIRELDSSMVYDIGPEGAVLGRERARTDIAFRDESISKRHARIFVQNGGWFLEDLGSSNGTYVDSQRITEPFRLQPGMSFSLAQKKFSVVMLDGGEASSESAASSPPSGGYAASARPPDDPTGLDASADGARGGAFSVRGDVSDPAGDQDSVEAKGFGYFFVAVPKAVAFYMVAVPALLLNPFAIGRRIREQKQPAMGRMELIAYALPSFLTTALLGLVGGLLAGLIAGQGIGSLIGGLLKGIIISAALSIVVAIVSGLIAHPVLQWLVDVLKGQSTAKSRTNCFLMLWTVAIIFAVPNAVTPIIAAFNVPFINLIPLLVAFLASAILLFIVYLWAREFGVAKWVGYVLLGLGAAYAVFTAVGLVRTAIYSVDRVLSGGSAAGVAAGPGTEGIEALTKQAEALQARLAAGEITAEEYQKQAEALAKAVALAQTNAASAAATPEAGSDSATADPATAPEKGASGAAEKGTTAAGSAPTGTEANPATGKEPTSGGKEPAAGGKDAGAAAKDPTTGKETTASGKDPGSSTKEPVAGAKPPVTGVAAGAAKPGPAGADTSATGKNEKGSSAPASGTGPTPGGASSSPAAQARPPEASFADYRDKRKAVEDAIDNDPRLLRDEEVQDEYRKLLTVVNQRNKHWSKKRAKTPADERINARLKEADIFERTQKIVERLHQKIFGR